MRWVSIVLLLMLVVIPLASGAEFDNRLRSYDDATRTAIIDDNFGLGGDLVKIQLMENSDNCLTSCYSIWNVTVYDDEDNFLSDMHIMNLRQTGRAVEYEFAVLSGYESVSVDNYEPVCTNARDLSTCTRQYVDSTTKRQEVWTTFNPERKLPVGNYIIKFTGNKKWEETVDWIPTFYGVEIPQWAFWASVDPVGAWEFNESSGGLFSDDSAGGHDFSTVDGGVSLVTGHIGNAVKTDTGGVNVINTTGDADWAFGTGDFTVCMWINETVGGSGTNIINNDFTSGGWSIGMQTVGGALTFNAAGVNRFITPDGVLQTGAFRRACYVREGTGSNEFKFYVDNDNIANGTSADDFTNSATDLKLYEANQADGRMIDNLQIYKGYAFTVADINEDWNGGAGKSASFVSSTVSLNAPADATTQITSSVDFNCSATGTTKIMNVSLYVDGALNYTETGNATAMEVFQTVGGFSNAQHNWTCTSRSEDNVFAETGNRTFTITDFLEASQWYNTSSYEGSKEVLSVNVSLNSTKFPTVTATLHYNGSTYAGTTSDTGNDRTYIADLFSPQTDAVFNQSFYWSFIFANSTGNFHFNSTEKNQSILLINASLHSFPYNPPFINFTVYDQDNLTLVSPKLSSSFEYGTSSLFQNLSYSDQTGTVPTFSFSFSPAHIDFLAKGDLEFVKANYVTNNYVLPQSTLNNITTNISVYMLNTSRSTSFIVEVKDSSFDAVSGAVVESQRFYPSTGTWITVESMETNVDGKTVGHFVTEDVSYRFLVTVDGVLRLTSTPTLIFCETSPCKITLKLPSTIGDGFENYDDLDSYTSSLTYSSTTETFTFSYTDTNTTTQGGRLRVVRTNFGTSTNVEICNNAESSGTAVITCDISSEINGTYTATGYSNRTSDESKVTERITIKKIRDIVSDVGLDGVIWSAFFLMALAMLWIISPAVSIIGAIFGVIAISLLGLVSFPIISIIAIIAVGAILLWEVTR